jgi:protein O-GlcNAc transferase
LGGNVSEWMSKALGHYQARQWDAAAAIYRRVIKTEPLHREAPLRLAEVLLAQGRPRKAIPVLEAATNCLPDDAELHRALADTLQVQGDRARAIDAYRRAVELDPNLEDAWWGLGCALAALDDHAAAADSFRRLTELRPDHGQAWHNFGKSVFLLGQTDAALDAYRKAATVLPAELRCVALGTIATVIPGSPTSENRAILEARRAWAEQCVLTRPAGQTLPNPSAETGRPVRLGYVTSFFDKRNWMKPVWGTLEHHDRSKFEIHVFSDAPEPDPQNGYHQDPRDRIHNVIGLSNDSLAGLIGEQAIDLLIDLNAYSRPARLPLFALRPAPVQLAWFNMFATSGMACFDYLVGDAHVILADEDAFYTERVLRVPGSYLTFQVPYAVPGVVQAPCVKRGYLTFGCLAPQYKISTEVVGAWSRILQARPETRLVLKNTMLGMPSGREFVRDLFARFGVPVDRLDLDGPDEHFTFLERYNDIDIALDTFPYNGGTTTMEAIWQGVPVLTFAGDRWAARISASLLREAGLGEFVAPNVDGFVAQAIVLAGDSETPARLDALRRTMRDRLRVAPVCDVARFTRNMEEIYSRVWQRCQDERRS